MLPEAWPPHVTFCAEAATERLDKLGTITLIVEGQPFTSEMTQGYCPAAIPDILDVVDPFAQRKLTVPVPR